MIRQTIPTQLRQLGDDQVECILSTNTLARDGHILEPQGADLAAFRANPICLWQHDPFSPVGTFSAITAYSDRIAARMTFAPLGVSEIADQVRGLVKGGVVSSLSVGFDPIDGTPLDPARPRGGQRFRKWELLECSYVSVPADPGAVVTARNYQRDQTNAIRASEAVLEARRHHQDLHRELRRENLSGALAAHRKLGRCLDTAERCLRGLSDNTELEAQVSNGMSGGQSDGGRAVPATLRERLNTVLQLHRPFIPDGSADGVATVRELEFARAQAHAAAVMRTGAFTRPATRAERLADLARLTRTQ